MHKVEITGVDTSKLKTLSNDEMNSLLLKIKDKDMQAREKMIQGNIKLVLSVLKRFNDKKETIDDLFQVGCIGLMKAIDRFDYEKGYKTISYSVWWIKQAILEALKERTGIEGESLPQDYEKQNSLNDDEYTVDNIVKDEYIDYSTIDDVKTDELKSIIIDLIDCLTEREKYVISEYFGLESKKCLTLEDIGSNIGLTKERVRQIKEKALKKLRSEALNNSITSDIYK
jgi:RNA polymerase sigma factor (sigma-70 family)